MTEKERRTHNHDRRLAAAYGPKFNYGRLLKAQGGRCAICGTRKPGGIGGRWASFHVDHSHRNGVVRGLLCTSCNRGLGYFHDDLVLLGRATRYLRVPHTGELGRMSRAELREEAR